MNSEPLKSFLETGEKPRSQKQISVLLDQSRNQLLSNPTNLMNDEFINSLSEAEIASITAQKSGTLDRLHAAYLAKQKPTARPAKKPDRIAQLCSFITKPRKPLSPPVEKNTQTASKAAPAPALGNKLKGASYAILHQAATHRSSPLAEQAAARAQLTAAHGVTITESGITSHSTRGGRAIKLSKI